MATPARLVLAALAAVVGTAAAGDVRATAAIAPSMERVAVADSGAQPDADVSNQASMTPDGRFVAFVSASANLGPAAAAGTAPFAYLRDRQLGRTELVGSGVDGAPVISADGRFVAFSSHASDLVAGDTNGVADVFVVDRATGTTTRAS